MRLRRAPPVTRIAAAVGLATLLVLMGLSAVDYATRRSEAAPWQAPRQLAPGIALRTEATAARRSSVSSYAEIGRAPIDVDMYQSMIYVADRLQ